MPSTAPYESTLELQRPSRVGGGIAYLSSHNPNAAAAFAVKVKNTEKRIADFPTIGKSIDMPNARRLLVGGYILVYELRDDEAVISYIRHGSSKRPWEKN